MTRGGFLRRVTRVFLTSVKGVVTRKPPVRATDTELQAQKRMSLQVRLRTHVVLGAKNILGAVKGHITRNPPVRPPHVASQAIPRAILRPKLRTHATLQKTGKVFGKSTKAPLARRPIELLQAVKRMLLKPRLKTETFFLKRVFGRPTQAPLARRPEVLLQSKRRPPRIRSFFVKAIRSTAVVVITVFPKAIRVLDQAVKRRSIRFRSRTTFLKVFGQATSKPKVVGPKVLLSSRLRLAIQPRLKTHIQTFKVFGRVIQTVFPKAIQVASLAIFKRQHPAQARFTKVFGVRTTRPPIRPVSVIHFAAQARMKLRAIHGVASLRGPAKPPVVTPPNLHKLFMDIVTGRLYWQVSQSSNPTLIMPL